nr:MAG TPA: hypothetical protein [Caudoviricetes sp.]
MLSTNRKILQKGTISPFVDSINRVSNSIGQACHAGKPTTPAKSMFLLDLGFILANLTKQKGYLGAKYENC